MLARLFFLFTVFGAGILLAGDCSGPSDCQATSGYLSVISVAGGLAALGAGLFSLPRPGTPEWDTLHPEPQITPPPPVVPPGPPPLMDRGQRTRVPPPPTHPDPQLQSPQTVASGTQASDSSTPSTSSSAGSESPRIQTTSTPPPVPLTPLPIDNQSGGDQSATRQGTDTQITGAQQSAVDSTVDRKISQPTEKADSELQQDFGKLLLAGLTEDFHFAAKDIDSVSKFLDDLWKAPVSELRNKVKTLPEAGEATANAVGAAIEAADEYHKSTAATPAGKIIDATGAAESTFIVNPAIGVWDTALQLLGDGVNRVVPDGADPAFSAYLKPSNIAKTFEVQNTLSASVNAVTTLGEALLTGDTSGLLAEMEQADSGERGLLFKGYNDLGKLLADNPLGKAEGNLVEDISQYYAEHQTAGTMITSGVNAVRRILGF